MITAHVSQKPKRKYSKNGCRECKRRKMKCDETKPNCWQCSRLDKPCYYDLGKEFKKRKAQETRPGTGAGAGAVPEYRLASLPAISAAPHHVPSAKSDSKTSLSSILNKTEPAMRPTSAPSTSGGSTSASASTGSTSFQPVPVSVPDHELSAAVSTVRALVHDFSSSNITSQSQHQPQHHQPQSQSKSQSLHHQSQHIQEPLYFDVCRAAESVPGEASAVSESSFDVSVSPLSSECSLGGVPSDSAAGVIALHDVHTNAAYAPFAEAFYTDFMRLVLPFAPFNRNPVRDVVLARARSSRPCVAYAVLACGAWTRGDHGAATRFLSQCSETLAEASVQVQVQNPVQNQISVSSLTNLGSSSTGATHAHAPAPAPAPAAADPASAVISALLVATLQLLSRGSTQWTHDLASVRALAARIPKNTRVHTVCAYWLAAYASVPSQKSAAPAVGISRDQLHAAGILIDQDFNIWDGITWGLERCQLDVENCLVHPAATAAVSPHEINSLIARISAERLFEHISSSGLIDTRSPYHYTNLEYGDELLMRRAESRRVPGVTFLYTEAGVVLYSWRDIVHQSHLLAAMLEVYTRLLGLPGSNRLVAHLALELYDMSYYVAVLNDAALCDQMLVLRHLLLKVYRPLEICATVLTQFDPAKAHRAKHALGAIAAMFTHDKI